MEYKEFIINKKEELSRQDWCRMMNEYKALLVDGNTENEAVAILDTTW